MLLLQRKIPATLIIVAINLLVFILVGTSKDEVLSMFFRFHTPLPFFGFGVTWITSAFYHQELSHIFWNLFFLALAGMTIEKRLGTGGLWCLFLGTCILSNIGTLLWYENDVASYGASAITYAFIVYCLLTHQSIFLWGQGDNALTVSSWWLLAFFTYQDFLVVLFPSIFVAAEINSAAHMGGVLMGVLFWRFFDPYKDYRFVANGWKEALFTLAFIAFSLHLLELKKLGGLKAARSLYHFSDDTDGFSTESWLETIRTAVLSQQESQLKMVARTLCAPVRYRPPFYPSARGVFEVRQLASVLGVPDDHPGFQLLLEMIQNPEIQSQGAQIGWSNDQ